MKEFFKKLGRTLLGAFYLAIPIVGWIALARSIKRVGAGEISIINYLNGSYEVIEEGLYFRPVPGDKFGNSFSKDSRYIDLGTVKRVRILPGEKGVMVEKKENKEKQKEDLVFKELDPGIHFIRTDKNQTFDPKTGIQKINQLDYTLGATRYVTIRNGELGKAFRSGKFCVLETGVHPLGPNDIFEGSVRVDQDIVNLGPLVIVTVKEGQAAIVNGKHGCVAYGPGKHYIQIEEGNFFNGVITVSPQLLDLGFMEVICSDRIGMNTGAVILYSIKEPLKTVGSGIDRVLKDLKEYAHATLRSILRNFNSSDIAISLHVDEKHDSHIRKKMLDDIHKSFVGELDARSSGWGIHIEDLQITHILPANKEYAAKISELATKQSAADAEKILSETKAVINEINARAEQSKVTAAKIEQEEAKVRAETEAKIKIIAAEAKYNVTVTEAKGQAESIKIITEAETESQTKFGQVADGFKTDIAKRLALIREQTKFFGNVKDPILMPPPDVAYSFWNQKDNRLTHFTNQAAQKSGSSNVLNYLDLEYARKLSEIPQPRAIKCN